MKRWKGGRRERDGARVARGREGSLEGRRDRGLGYELGLELWLWSWLGLGLGLRLGVATDPLRWAKRPRRGEANVGQGT